ncbi:murein hydrolase activator EnvC family protein [Caproiciproducens faecalis]|uniref:Peptidoglycan DD-metalloendopeptidase family protein n=1 Tax=Caproiciproducens faecalis TaxID=2820301 RepID=A0ABS7DN64_9FIRM|nr:peptidoglycan DD-metalloendopeptidase family protein [Caproiciproducens faecalis]MBW7572739.1 peptidoglycan DD-metalloendopeptidase family protein [Caproiciproducens faecalis]
MAGKKWAKGLVAVVLALAMIFTPQVAMPASAAKSLSQLQKEQTELKKKQAQVAAKLKTLKADKAQKQQYKAALDTQVATVQSQIDVLNQQIRVLDGDISQKEAQIADKQKSINTNYEQLKQRLRALYLTGEASNLEIILSAKSVVDLADKTEAIQAITTHDTNLINTLKSDMDSIKTQKQEIESNRESVANAKVTLNTKQSELTSLVNETQAVIAEIAQNESDANQESKKLAEQRKKADAAIDQWYKDYYASQKGTGGSGGYVSKGNFTWPVPGVTNITSGYGYRWGSLHKGIDISSAGVYGKPIVAADSGKVMMAGWGNYGTGYGGYGYVVAIDHGGGYSTLYGHCSSVAVSKGQTVKKGQVIAYVGSSGDSTGAHLHFEIRVNGVAKNPMNWFSR